MKTKEIVTQAEKLSNNLRNSILSIIDTKTEYDMEQVIGKIDQMQNQTQQIESRLESQMQQIRWFIGGAIAIVGILVTAIFKTITLGSAIALR